MSDSLTPTGSQDPRAHALANELAATLVASTAPRVLMLGVGNGRNLPPLLAAGAHVDIVEDDPENAREAIVRFSLDARVRVTRARYGGPFPFAAGYAAALSTHGLLHGMVREVEDAIAAIANRLVPGGALFATLGSQRDPRYALGTPLAPGVSAPRSGNERDVAHAYFDEPGARRLLEAFAIDSLYEASAARSAGRWAHDPSDAAIMVHWFVRARKRGAISP